ncbi:phosphotransferase [Mycolicibacterium goodii]|uniref:phosphotransferase n=1 Tax=Mycolicibacterium goodii TaxID=134601 RepID=UPI0006732E9B
MGTSFQPAHAGQANSDVTYSCSRPGFLARQVALWTRQWHHVKSRELPDVAALSTALAAALPPSLGASIIHGDFRIDNTIQDPTLPQPLRAVIDWELSTLGDPLTDVALMCVYRSTAFNQVLGMPAAWTSDRLSSPDDIAQQYAQLSGRDLSNWNFYLALANFKLAVIAEGITHRAAVGPGVPGADAAAEVTPELLAEGLRLLASP